MREVRPIDIETISLLVPRGLITAVLAFEIVDTKGASFNFLPGLVFSVILLSNILMLVATIRRPGAPQDVPASDAEAAVAEPLRKPNSANPLAPRYNTFVSDQPTQTDDVHGSLGR